MLIFITQDFCFLFNLKKIPILQKLIGRNLGRTSGLRDNFEKILNSIIRLSKHNIQIIITYPNSDYGGKKIIEKINKLKNIKNIECF